MEGLSVKAKWKACMSTDSAEKYQFGYKIVVA